MPTETAAPRPGRGLLVAFEGIDGAGKSTQARRLAARLEQSGVPVLTTKEPTDGPWGRKIRASATAGRLPVEEELEAFIEDRRAHVRDELAPALAAGQVVIVDRYFLSNVAYQGARGLDPMEIVRRNAFAPAPDLCVILDIEPHVGLSRVARRGDVADLFEKEEALSAARRIFLDASLFRNVVTQLWVLDATAEEGRIAEEIADWVFAALGRR